MGSESGYGRKGRETLAIRRIRLFLFCNGQIPIRTEIILCVTGKFSILVTADPGHFLKNGSGMEVRTIINLAEARCKPDKSTAQMYLSKI